MKFIQILIILAINLYALDFKQNIDVIGKWKIYTIPNDEIKFFAGVISNKWEVEFLKSGAVNINGIQEMEWIYNKNRVDVYHNRAIYEKINENLSRMNLKILDTFKDNCFLVINDMKKEFYKMCKIEDENKQKKIEIIIHKKK